MKAVLREDDGRGIYSSMLPLARCSRRSRSCFFLERFFFFCGRRARCERRRRWCQTHGGRTRFKEHKGRGERHMINSNDERENQTHKS